MTHSTSPPHLGACPLCEQGLIRAARCPHCESWIAVCDECEALWKDPHSVRTSRPDTQHPSCPNCKQAVEHWNFGNTRQLAKAGLSDLIHDNHDRNT